MRKTVNLPSGDLVLDIEQTDFPLDELCGFACRQNPKRGFLFVSKVLGKHYPVKPSKMKQTYDVLSSKLNVHLNNDAPVLFLGFAETAIGLGAGVYETWKKLNNQESMYVHTTRYEFNQKILFRFEEEHSHATGHIVYEPKNDFHLVNYKTLVLIDDEMSTGKTAMNFIEQFIQLEDCSINKIVLVCLKNWMSKESRLEFVSRLKNQGVEVEFVSLLQGNYQFIKNEDYVCQPMPNVESTSEKKDGIITGNNGRFGLDVTVQHKFDKVISKVKGKKILVLGTGEFSYQPYKLAEYLENKGLEVSYQSTTRSPILVGDIIEAKLEFVDNYNDKIDNFIYNVSPNKYDQVFICYETVDKFDCNLDKILNAENIFFKDLQ